MNRHPFLLTLQSAQEIAPNTKHFVFTASQENSIHSISFLPGQFITLHFPSQDKLFRRSYSLANYCYGGSTPQLELAASYIPDGIASERLFMMQPGDTLEATGPAGRLTLRDESVTRYLLIATGTGVTPYRAMLPELAERMKKNNQLHIILLFGVRTYEDMLYRDEFVKFSEEHERFELRVYYSRAKLHKLDYEYLGYVSAALDDRLSSEISDNIISINPHEDIAYLCGNPNMVDDVYHLLSDKGLTIDKIRREKYISPKS